MTPESIILAKRNKRPNTREEIDYFVDSFVRGAVKDYQMTAWMMAICINGMNSEETANLTSAMVRSGEVLDWNNFPDGAASVDKHSTGGVGDKISLILAPLVASFGVKVPMMAGRGLGHTGGTIDKLESIGMRTDVASEEFRELVASVGAAIVSPSKSMVPADKQMYALRDVTGTVTSLPLQTSSIMSKKLAENPDSIVLDVKIGRAAFQDSTSLKVLCPVSPVVLGLCPVSRGRDLAGAPQDATVARWRQTMRQMKAKILEVTVLYSCRRWWGVAVPRWAVVQSIRFRPQNRLPQASTGAARGINYFSPHLSHDQSLILPCRGNIDWVIRRHFRRYRGDL